MIEVIKKIPVLIALLTGKRLTFKDDQTGDTYEVGYSVKEKKYTVMQTMAGMIVKVSKFNHIN